MSSAAEIVVDASIWVEALAGVRFPALDEALNRGLAVIAPLVLSELVTGAHTPSERAAIGELLQEAPLHPCGLEHWIRVGDLRRVLAYRGVNVTVPDAHVAQCALDRNAELLAKDGVFELIARHTPLRLVR